MANPPLRPTDHPFWFPSFEYSLPLSFHAATVKVQHEHLISDPERYPGMFERYSIICPFCIGIQQRWAQITAYWSHLKVLHTEKPRIEVLEEIRRSAREYTLWIQDRALDYQRGNSDTWVKLQQAQAPDFDWHVLEGWRLNMDRYYERWLANTMQSEHNAVDRLAARRSRSMPPQSLDESYLD